MSADGACGVVLVTGVARYLGAHLAARLAADRQVGRVIGVDAAVPSVDLQKVLDGVEVHQVDPATPEVAGLLVDAQVEVVAHLAVATTPDLSRGGRPAMKELNVIGTMQLLAACQQAPTLRGLVVRSSTAAYGASFRDPAVLTEDTEPLEMPRGGFARDILEIEGYVRGFRRRRPAVRVTVLRFAPFIGPEAETGFTRYLAQRVVPTVLGRDPRLQFVHVDDAFEVMHQSVVGAHPGTFNVAGPGTLTLSQLLRRAGRFSAPTIEQGLNAGAALARGAGSSGFSLDRLDLLVHGRVVDTSRLVAEFGFEPRSTATAVDDFLRTHRASGPIGPETVSRTEQIVLDQVRWVRHAIRELRGPR